jgi:hypothetical protein
MKKTTQMGCNNPTAPTTLDSVYHSLPPVAKAPKQEFVERMAAACKCSEQTVRMWICGTQTPSNELTVDALLKAMVQYGYIESMDSVDKDHFFKKQLMQEEA